MSDSVKATTPDNLQAKLKKTSKRVHDVSNVLVTSKLVVLFTDRVLYGQAIACFYYIFQHLELLIEELLVTEPGQPLLPSRSRSPSMYLMICGTETRHLLVFPHWFRVSTIPAYPSKAVPGTGISQGPGIFPWVGVGHNGVCHTRDGSPTALLGA